MEHNSNKNPNAVALGSLGGKVKGPCKARSYRYARRAAMIRWRREKASGKPAKPKQQEQQTSENTPTPAPAPTPPAVKYFTILDNSVYHGQRATLHHAETDGSIFMELDNGALWPVTSAEIKPCEP
jgi:hypothetical protein